MIVITLSPEQSRDPATEPLGRDRVGYRDGMTPAELYHANHGTWVIGHNRLSESFALFTFRGEVKQAWSQAVSASPASIRAWSSASAGVLKPSVLRGLRFSFAAISSSSA